MTNEHGAFRHHTVLKVLNTTLLPLPDPLGFTMVLNPFCAGTIKPVPLAVIRTLFILY